MRWLTGKAILAMFGCGVVLCLIWWLSGKMGTWPVDGIFVLAAWLPLQVWHSALGRSLSNSPPSGRVKKTGEGGIPDAELAALVAAWPTLPEPIKAAIRALVGSIK